MLDIDSSRVDMLRRLGIKVYYGDASRYDLLESAGAARAKLLVVAIQDLGAAGISCATSETAGNGGMGMDVDLDKGHSAAAKIVLLP